jgi:hypothetical protein
MRVPHRNALAPHTPHPEPHDPLPRRHRVPALRTPRRLRRAVPVLLPRAGRAGRRPPGAPVGWVARAREVPVGGPVEAAARAVRLRPLGGVVGRGRVPAVPRRRGALPRVPSGGPAPPALARRRVLPVAHPGRDAVGAQRGARPRAAALRREHAARPGPLPRLRARAAQAAGRRPGRAQPRAGVAPHPRVARARRRGHGGR